MQGRILGTDNASFIEVQLFEGYTVPEPGGRIMFFSPVGDLFRGYQVPSSAHSKPLPCLAATFTFGN